MPRTNARTSTHLPMPSILRSTLCSVEREERGDARLQPRLTLVGQRAPREGDRVARAVDDARDARVVRAERVRRRVKRMPSGRPFAERAGDGVGVESAVSFTSTSSSRLETPSESAGPNVISGFGW